MCLIAYRYDPKAHIPKDVIDYNLRINPDGFGITWQDSDTGVLHTQKFAPQEKKGFVRLLKRIDRTRNVYVAHWRKATHGEVSRDMSHPFTYDDLSGRRLIAFHNGIIPISTVGQESDTLAFVNRILRRLPFGWWNDGFYKSMIEDAIGWSRMLFWTPKGIVRLNERQWVDKGGITYSTAPGPWTGNYLPATTGSYRVVPRESVFGEVEDDDDGTIANAVGWTVADDTIETIHSGINVGHVTRVETENKYWVHRGHTVTQADRWRADDPAEAIEYTGRCECLTCGEEGDYYVIDGQAYTDMDHVKPTFTPNKNGWYD